MSAILSDIDANDVHDVTKSISELANNASALAVNAIAVAKSASQLRLNEKLLTTVSKLNESHKTGNYFYNDTAPMSGFSSRATTLAPVFSNTSRISIMPTQSSTENGLPAATSSGVDNSLTSISTINKQKNNKNTNSNNRTSSTVASRQHSTRPNSNRHSQNHSVASNNSSKASPSHKNQSHNSIASHKTNSSSSRMNDPKNNSRVYETLYDSVAKAPTPRSSPSSSSSPTPTKSTVLLPKYSQSRLLEVLPNSTSSPSSPSTSASSSSSSSRSPTKSHTSILKRRKNSDNDEVPIGGPSIYEFHCKNNESKLAATISFQGTNTIIHRQKSSTKSDIMNRSRKTAHETSTVTNIAKDIIELQAKYNSDNLLSTPVQSSRSNQMSSVEEAILKSTHPIMFDNSEEIEINGIRGILANKSEILKWKGPIPINQYKINEDPDPEIITKKSKQHIEYVQELAIRYLKPPTPPSPGEIIIKQLPNVVPAPAPPLILRQQPPRPCTPEPLVIREAPPQPPEQVGRKVITISGKKLPPPPRKVVIERLAPLPSKPQSVIIERWLPYADVKRRVIFNKPCQPDPVVIPPKNVVIQWDAPSVQIKKEFKYLGVIRANPCDYVQRFKDTIRDSNDLPEIVSEIPTPGGLVLAADYKSKNVHELEGDLDALNLIDLDNEGLSEYKQYLKNFGKSGTTAAAHALSSVLSAAAAAVISSAADGTPSANESTASSSSGSVVAASSPNSPQYKLAALINKIFKLIDRDECGNVSVSDASAILLRLNSRLRRSYGEDDLISFFNTLDSNKDGKLDLDEFKKAFLNLEF